MYERIYVVYNTATKKIHSVYTDSEIADCVFAQKQCESDNKEFDLFVINFAKFLQLINEAIL